MNGSVAKVYGQNEIVRVETIKQKNAVIMSRVRTNSLAALYLSAVMNTKNTVSTATVAIIEEGSWSMAFMLAWHIV